MKLNRRYIVPGFTVFFGAVICILGMIATNAPIFEQMTVELIGFLFMVVGMVWADLTEMRILLKGVK